MTESPPILVVEDNDDDLYLMLMSLKKAGLPGPPNTVRDGADAIQYLSGAGQYSDRSKFPFPFVMFLDLKMPGLDGFEVLQWWKDQNRKEFLAIVVLTSSVRREDVERAYELGAVSYLCKPTELDDLTGMVRRAVEYWSLVKRSAPQC